MPPIPATNQNGRRLFYCNGKISTEINGDARWRFLQANDLILALNKYKTPGLLSTLAACDQQRSVLSMYDGESPESHAYSPYGHHIPGSGLLSLLAFNGERRDAVTGHYHLGNGYRQLSPVMMRFCSPDSWSPFGAGGFNAYVYCAGDPTNRTDPTGHFWGIGKFFRRLFGLKPKAPRPVNTGMPVAKKNKTQHGRASSIVPEATSSAKDDNPFVSLSNQEIDQQLEALSRFTPGNASSGLARNSIRPQISLDRVEPSEVESNFMRRRRQQEELNRAQNYTAGYERLADAVAWAQLKVRNGPGSSKHLAALVAQQQQLRQWHGN